MRFAPRVFAGAVLYGVLSYLTASSYVNDPGSLLQFESQLLVAVVPYAVAVISVDGAAGCNVMGNVVGCAPEAVKIGDRVRAFFDEVKSPQGDQVLKIPNWQRV